MGLESLAILISTLALTVSVLTFSLTFFWGGKIKYSKPSQIWMGYSADQKRAPLVYFRFYAHSTGLAGKLIEALFLEVKRGQAHQKFNIWTANVGSGYKNLAGMQVFKNGMSLENIFQPDRSDQKFQFLAGMYEFKLFSKEIKSQTPKQIAHVKYELTKEQCELIEEGKYIVLTLRADGTGYSSYSEDPAVDSNKVLVNQMVEKMVSEIKKIDKKES